MRAIIPCAGFGTRMGMKPNESKELLIDPVTKRPMIEWCLDLCEEHSLEPIIILRKEKQDLIDYCLDKNIDFMEIIPEGEWMNSVLKSEGNWRDVNLLILPDTRFHDTNIIGKMHSDLINGANASIALHKVFDPEKWCCLETYTLYEKDKSLEGTHWAFGLIAFTQSYGQRLFKDLSKPTYHHLQNASFQYLESFEDITRNGKFP
jgi:dTDP-glucose pyrophosphorylase